MILERQLQFDRVVRRMSKILLRAEIPFSGLHRRVPQQQLDLLKFATCSAAELGGCAPQVMWRDIRQASPGDVRLQHLPDNLFAHPQPANLIAPIDCPEQVALRYSRHQRPRIDRIFRPGWHRDRSHPPVLADKVHDAPPVVPLLHVLHGEVRQFGPAQSAPEQRGEHCAVA
jgi:hypothetical protein